MAVSAERNLLLRVHTPRIYERGAGGVHIGAPHGLRVSLAGTVAALAAHSQFRRLQLEIRPSDNLPVE